jgi:hypothetical protein
MTLYDNNNINYTEWYQEFVEYCEANEIDHTQYDEESEYFLNWLYDSLNLEWEDFIENLTHSEHNTHCVVVGSVGTWRGNFDIEPKHFDTINVR